MSSITLNVTHQNITKKISASKGTTISQIAQLASEKFAITTGHVGILKTSDGKLLDSSLPLRLTNLGNNSHLRLETTVADTTGREVQIKLTVVSKDRSVQNFIAKVNSINTLQQMINEFEQKHSVQLLKDGEDSQLVILNLTYASNKYSTTTLQSVVGSNNSAVIRMSYLESEDEKKKRILMQDEINRKQIEKQKLWLDAVKQKREEKVKEAEKSGNANIGKDNDELREREQPEPERRDDDTIITAAEGESRNSTIEKATSDTSAVHENPTQTDSKVKEIPAKSTTILDETPRLYVPSDTPSKTYENPDEDYNMTASQAELYRRVVAQSAKPTQHTGEKAPTKYNVRIRFPDRSILQIDFHANVEALKLGQLVKRIDDLIHEDFIGKYSLRTSYPSRKIELSFTNNNTLLSKIPEFKEEQVSLIWVPNTHSEGPFVKSGAIAHVQTSSELPEVILEQGAQDLLEEEAKTGSRVPKRTNGQASGRKVPKWFKP